MVNKVTLIGNLGTDPEIKTVFETQKVASFSLATSENFKNKDGAKETKTEWHNIVIWGKLAEVVESYVKKGDKIYLEGKIQQQSWEKDGQKHYRTNIVCNNMTMLGGKPTGTTENEPIGEDIMPF